MATQHQRTSVTRLLCTLVLSSLLLACSSGLVSQRLADTPPDMFSTPGSSAEQYMKQVDGASEPDAFTWQVLAIRAWLQQDNLTPASTLLARLQQNASQTQLPVLTLLTAELALAKGDDTAAEQQLARINPDALAPAAASYYLQLQAKRLEYQQQPIAAAAMLIQRQERLSGPEQVANLERIHGLLATVPVGALRDALGAYHDESTLGWLRLMAILNAGDTHADQRNWQLQSWRNSYPEHPAQQYLPDGIDAGPAPALDSHQPTHIAVLLPLSGSLAKQADAVRNGILSAHQGQSSRLSFFDTQSKDMASIYQQIQAAGADFILGPLLKEEVDALANLDPAIPVLALNLPAKQPDLPHRYYFSLSPEAEAAEAALHMFEQGHRQPLVFAPNNELGKRSATHFTLRWQQLTGQAARVAYFSSKQAIEADVRRALASQPSAAPAGVIQPVSASGSASAIGPIDSIFMASNATETRFILPYFDFVRDSRAKRLPTYVTSRSYIPGGSAPMSELNGVQLADMPWLFGSDPQLMAQVEQLWPGVDASWLRLFALGYDAEKLIPQLTDLRTGSTAAPGLSGELKVNERGVIERRTQWMEYKDGQWQQPLESTSLEQPQEFDQAQ